MNRKSAEQPIRHVAIIPDGNRRWAREKGLPDEEGHIKCFLEVTPKLLGHLWSKEIHTVTLWMFSTDNWNRRREEIERLMMLFEKFLKQVLTLASDHQVTMVHIGRKDRVPAFLQEIIETVEDRTERNAKGTLLLGLDYSGRDEIMRAMQRMLSSGAGMQDAPFEKYLDTAAISYPDPDIIIRTSGEMRTSGFMPWQSVYSEYFFIDKYYPDMCTADLDKVISDYYKRSKRYGH